MSDYATALGGGAEGGGGSPEEMAYYQGLADAQASSGY